MSIKINSEQISEQVSEQTSSVTVKTTANLANQPVKPARKWNLVVLALYILVPGMVIMTAYWLLNNSGGGNIPQTPTTVVAPPMVGALGRIEPEGEVLKVAPPSTLGSSRIIQLKVKEGEQVKANQVIALLDGYDRAIATVKQAEAQVQLRRSQLAQVKAGGKTSDRAAQIANRQALEASLQRLSSELEIAEKDLNRYQLLLAAGASSEIVRDSYALKVKTLKGQIAQTRKQILQADNLAKSVEEVKPSDIRVAEAQLQSAIADLDKAKVELIYTEVRAPIAGEILKVIAKAGEAVSGATGVVEMGNTKQMYVVAEVYETDIAKVKPGQQATITSAVLAQPITGKVERIIPKVAKNDVLGTDPATRTDVRVVEVKIRLDQSEPVAKFTNMQVDVRIDL